MEKDMAKFLKYADRMEKFYKAWDFIENHPQFMDGILNTFPYGLSIEVVKVNPKTMKIDDDDAKNIKVQIWLEHGPYDRPLSNIRLNIPAMPTHDIRLDCGADTFESAIIKLANLIKKYYGNYESQETQTEKK